MQADTFSPMPVKDTNTHTAQSFDSSCITRDKEAESHIMWNSEDGLFSKVSSNQRGRIAVSSHSYRGPGPIRLGRRWGDTMTTNGKKRGGVNDTTTNNQHRTISITLRRDHPTNTQRLFHPSELSHQCTAALGTSRLLRDGFSHHKNSPFSV